jgi:hypothetical protein
MAEQIKFGDNLYLQGERLVLDNGANAGVISSENGTVKIEGNLTVTGTTTTVNSETVTFADSTLLLNSNETGTPSEDGGIEIERGTATNKLLTWSESSDKWTVGAETFVAGKFEGPLTGTTTGLHLGGLDTQGADLLSTGLSELNDVRIWLGSINDTTIGAITPAAGTFSTITGDGTAITNVLANYTTTNLPEGTNKYFTDERVDDRIDSLFTNAYGISGTYNDAGNVYTLAFDPVNAGSAIAVLDTTDTTQAKFRTIREGQVGTGGHGDLTVALSGDEIVIDTAIPINHVAYNSYTGNGSVSIYTLPYSVSQDWQALVYIDGVIQHPTINYSISGTTLTLTSPLGNSAVMNVVRMATNSVSSSITDANTLGGNLPNHYLSWAQTTGTPTTLAGYGITDAKIIPFYYANQAAFPNASTNHGAIAHSHSDGAMYFAHGGSWNKMANSATTLSGYGITDGLSLAGVDSHLNQSNPTSGYVLSWNGSDYTWVNNAGYTNSDFDTRFATKSTTDLSEGTNLYYTDARSRAAISVSGDLSYNSSTGVISSSGLASSTSDDLAEGSTNLYYTAARDTAQFNTDFLNKSTTDLSEGGNLYYTTARATTDFDTRLATKSTTNLSEGTNLYYTDARADVRAQLKIDAIVDSAPGTLDTLNELAAALGDDANFSTTISNSIATKIGNVVEDTTPQLGGNLDLNTFDLTTTDPTVSLTTTLTTTTAQGTVGASSETNTSTSAVTVNTDNSDVANAVSSYVTLTSSQITSLGFEGDISLTYFGAAAPTSNFVWRDIGDSAEQNNMIIVYSPPAGEYTFTLPTNVSLPTTPGNQTPFNSDDADIYFKQYAYGEMTVTSATALNAATIQLKDANGFYIDKEHVTVTSLGGTSYKVVFWTHDVGVGDVIDVIAASAQTALFEWGTESFSEPGFVLTSEGFSVTSSTNDIFALGDLQITTGSVTGEVVGWAVYDSPTNNTVVSGLTTVTIDGTGYQSAITVSEVPIIMTGNADTSNELSLAVGSGTDARLWLLNNSGYLIYKFPAADGTANQVMKTDGSGDLVWANDNNTTYTAGTDMGLDGTVFNNTAPDQTVSLTGSGATTITGTYPNFTISSTDTTTTTSIDGNIIPATDNTYDLGSTSKKYANIYGHSIHATYADLAERYATDVPYLKGTVVVFGGEAEITTTTEAKDVSVAGVISTNPALKMNADAGNSQTHPYVALRGRVPCNFIGPVSKGDLIVTADNEPGYAQSIGKNDAGRSVFAKSLETDLTEGKKLIEVVIL